MDTINNQVQEVRLLDWSRKQCLFLLLPILIITIVVIVIFLLNCNFYESKIEETAKTIALHKEEYNALLKIKSTSERILGNRKNALKNLETIGLFLDNQEHYLNLQEYYNGTCKEWEQEHKSIDILGKYNSSWGKYCIAVVSSMDGNDKLLIRDLISKNTHTIKLDDFGCYQSRSLELFPNGKKDRAVFISNFLAATSITQNFGILNLRTGDIRNIDGGDIVIYENGKITIQTLVDIGESRAEGKRVCLYSYYNSDGEPIYLLRGDINANGYDSDGDRVSMDIHIDYFGNVSGNYECSGWFSDYKLSGKRGSDGVLRITGENTWGRDDATFVLSASYNGEIEGYCDNGSRKYEITLSY